MSRLTATARAGTRAPHQAPSAPGLLVVTGRPGQSTRGAAFAMLCAALLAAALMALLLLNTALGQGSYAVHDLQSTSGKLADRQNALTQALATQKSPAALAARAAAMGMVPADSVAFLRLSDGAILGVAAKATKGDGFTVVTDTQPPPVTPKPAVTTPATATPAGPKVRATKPGTPATAATPAPATKKRTQRTTR